MGALDHIHIFKTDILNENIHRLHRVFESVEAILQWNVDTEDCDRVLRVVSYELTENEIVQLVTTHGFSCEALE